MKRFLATGLLITILFCMTGCAPTPAEQEAIALLESIGPRLSAIDSYSFRVYESDTVTMKQTTIERRYGNAPADPNSTALDVSTYGGLVGVGQVKNMPGGKPEMAYTHYRNYTNQTWDYKLYGRDGVIYRELPGSLYAAQRDENGNQTGDMSWTVSTTLPGGPATGGPKQIAGRYSKETLSYERLLYRALFGTDEQPAITREHIESWSLSNYDGGKLLCVKVKPDKLPETLVDILAWDTTNFRHNVVGLKPLSERFEMRFVFDAAGVMVRCDLYYDHSYDIGYDRPGIQVHNTFLLTEIGTAQTPTLPTDLSGYTNVAHLSEEARKQLGDGIGYKFNETPILR